jgi:hypothetical protein
MSSTRQYIYISIFSIILIISFFAIFKLINQNKTISQSSPKPNSPHLETQIINWDQAEKLISECQVKSVFQNHQLEVTLRAYDNQIFQTTEPKIDDVFKLAKKYQGPCDIIQMISE